MYDDVGTWPKWVKNVVKIAVGVAAIAVGASIAAATGGTAITFTSSFMPVIKAATISGGVAAGLGGTISIVKSLSNGSSLTEALNEGAKACFDNFSTGFMAAGIVYGTSHVAGYITNNTNIFNRQVDFNKKNNYMFGNSELTLWRHGKNFRIDANQTIGLHYHLRTNTTGIGVHRTNYIPQIIGGSIAIFGAFND